MWYALGSINWGSSLVAGRTGSEVLGKLKLLLDKFHPDVVIEERAERLLADVPASLPADVGVAQTATQSFLDAINDVTNLDDPVVRLPCETNLMVSGWAIDTPHQAVARGVSVDIDGNQYKANYGIARHDVAVALRNLTYNRAGYIAVVPMAEIGTNGIHIMTVKILNYNASAYYVGRKIELHL